MVNFLGVFGGFEFEKLIGELLFSYADRITLNQRPKTRAMFTNNNTLENRYPTHFPTTHKNNIFENFIVT
jgi:hypothetical protein